MKGLSYIVFLLSSFFMTTSCIDEYHGDWENVNEQVLVVSGSIQSNSECTFILRRSNPISASLTQQQWDNYSSWLSSSYSGEELFIVPSPENNFVKGAVVTVESESGEVFGAQEYLDGHFSVYLSDLNPDDKYFLHVVLSDGEEYTSTPMAPIDAPEIVSAGWKMEGTDVQLNVSTGELNEPTYFSWEYSDVWEVRAPMQTFYEYDPVTDEIITVLHPKNIGWTYASQHSRIVSDNKNYGYGALKKYPLYKIDKDDVRFQAIYYTKIKQMAISREEYEYNSLILLYNSQMGGLFTPMPSELPTNIRSNKGKKGVGYVGVRGKICEAEVCIGREQVGCKYYVTGEVIPNSRLEKLSYSTLYSMGYRVYENDIAKGVTWTYQYCVDATYWGASLDRPSFWDEITLTPEDEE